MTQSSGEQEFKELDEHWAASRECCRKIGDRIGKPVKQVEGPVDKSPLPFRCLYDGPQTDFSGDEVDTND